MSEIWVNVTENNTNILVIFIFSPLNQVIAVD